MDKETLSNYGWIVIAVLVLVVMIALATPFGSFISEAIQSTTKGLFDVNKNALNAAGVPGLTVQDQEFDVPDMNGGAEGPVLITFTIKGTEYKAKEGMTWSEWVGSEYNTLNWFIDTSATFLPNGRISFCSDEDGLVYSIIEGPTCNYSHSSGCVCTPDAQDAIVPNWSYNYWMTGGI